MSRNEYEFEDLEEYSDPEEYEERPRRSSGGKHLKPGGSHARPARRSGERTGRGGERPSRARGEEDRPVRRRSQEDRPARVRGGSTTEEPDRPRPKKGKKKRTGRIILIVVLSLILLLALVGFLVFNHLYGFLNGGAKKPVPTATPAPIAAEVTPEPTEEPTPTPSPTPEPLTEEEIRELEEMKLRNELQEDAEDVMQDKNVYNILLLGADGRSERLERSDAMILVSINKETKTIWLTSLMRDTMVSIDGWYQPHLNWATSLGGVELLISTIESEKNFAIHIDNWALVNFVDFVEIADMMGSITVTLTDAEADDIDRAIREVGRMLEPQRRPYLYGGGTRVLDDGLQILGYCRERHIGGDTGRSEKQRDALIQLWGNVKQMTFTEQYALLEKAMSIIHTDLTRGQCLSLLLSAPSFMNYEIKTQQCPTPGAFWRGRDDSNLSVYYADFKVNRNFLRATIYNEPMTAADLTSNWTGTPVLVMEPTA